VILRQGTTPFGSSSPIIVPVGVQDIANGTEGMPMLVVSSRQTDVWVPVRLMGADVGHAQCARIPDGIETGLLASPCIGEDFPI